jgi:cytochrome c-type biogenesis protein CcmE
VSRGRLAASLALLVVAIVGGALVVSALDDNLVYYRTPSEVVAEPPEGGERIRLGGLVVAGSVSRPEGRSGTVLLRITDGAQDLEVVHRGPLPQIFAGGRGAIVEGVLVDGTFHSDELVVRHSNEYRPDEHAEPAPPGPAVRSP